MTKKKTQTKLHKIGIGISVALVTLVTALGFAYLDERNAYEIAESGGFYRTESDLQHVMSIREKRGQLVQQKTNLQRIHQ